MEELLVPNQTIGFVVPAAHHGRRTRYDLVSVYHGRELVSIDSRIGNRLVGSLLASHGLPELGPAPWISEFGWGAHRLDFASADRRGAIPRALLEVKCSNLRVGRTALFPDAPTARGRAHLDLLARAARRGLPCGVLFVVQRTDVREFRANRALDPEFARSLDRARAAGVRVWAFSARVRFDRVEWGRPLPVKSGPVWEPL